MKLLLSGSIDQLSDIECIGLQLRLDMGKLQVFVSEDVTNTSMSELVLETGYDLADGSWHRVYFMYGTDEISLGVDFASPDTIKLDGDLVPYFSFEPDSEIVIGISYDDSEPGKSSQSISKTTCYRNKLLRTVTLAFDLRSHSCT